MERTIARDQVPGTSRLQFTARVGKIRMVKEVVGTGAEGEPYAVTQGNGGLCARRVQRLQILLKRVNGCIAAGITGIALRWRAQYRWRQHHQPRVLFRFQAKSPYARNEHLSYWQYC
jgi:hypothetical protein